MREVDTAHNPPLMPEDIIVLPDTPKLKNLIVVMGEVNKPGVYPLNKDEEMSTVQAIALAGGSRPSPPKAGSRSSGMRAPRNRRSGSM
ncbi:MAG: hypothetical protein M5R38_08295 [Candidatus Methylomirabilis sp.]|nr:hypothetical protein [Candidatus Methylomirabilis sp.]